MIVKVSPSLIAGFIQAPASKSCTQRVLAAALLRSGKTVVENAGRSNDERAGLHIIQKMGAVVTKTNGNLEIESSENILLEKGEPITANCGESGLSMRMFTGIATLFNREIILEGEGSILTRPMDFADEYLPKLGVNVFSNDGKVPLRIQGPLKPNNIAADGSLSSQFITGLLYALGRAAKEPVVLKVKDLTSRPYIDLTLAILKDFGFNIENRNYESFIIHPFQNVSVDTLTYKVEGDWSNAAFLLTAAAVASKEKVIIKGMDRNSTQGDKEILTALENAGVAMFYHENGDIEVRSNTELKGFEFDAVHCPDLFPPLVALAANCQGASRIKGVHRLYHKESDRAAALREEFGKMGVSVSIEDDEMIIEGGGIIKGATISSHNDHRIAMSAAVAALQADAPIIIEGAEAVNKSYPGFYEDLKKLGVKLEEL